MGSPAMFDGMKILIFKYNYYYCYGWRDLIRTQKLIFSTFATLGINLQL